MEAFSLFAYGGGGLVFLSCHLHKRMTFWRNLFVMYGRGGGVFYLDLRVVTVFVSDVFLLF